MNTPSLACVTNLIKIVGKPHKLTHTHMSCVHFKKMLNSISKKQHCKLTSEKAKRYRPSPTTAECMPSEAFYLNYFSIIICVVPNNKHHNVIAN
jgi:hypothetical protein